MKRNTLVFLCAAVIAGVLSACSGTAPSMENRTVETTLAVTSPTAETEVTEPAESTETEPPAELTNDFRIALITRNNIDQCWLELETGAMRAAEELGCEVVNLSPVMQSDIQQAAQIGKAVSDGYDAIVVAVSGSDTISAALQEAAGEGLKIICVDGSAGVKADAVLCADDRAAGKAAGETLVAELEGKEIREGTIGIIAISPDTDVSRQREAGFREVFDGTEYTLMETQYSEGDAAKAHTLSRDFLDQNAVGIFCCSEGCTVGAGNAVKDSGSQTAVVGFGEGERTKILFEEGHLSAVLSQNSDAMGYEAVKAACAVLHGNDLKDAVIDTGISVLKKQ